MKPTIFTPVSSRANNIATSIRANMTAAKITKPLIVSMSILFILQNVQILSKRERTKEKNDIVYIYNYSLNYQYSLYIYN